MAFNHIFIIGAPRSGTNALRDLICASPLFVTWPCDEINYAWKYSNKSYRYDDLNINHINIDVYNYLHHMFGCLESKYKNANFLVEKTCANCLRIPFVNGIFNNSCYVYIRRDPRDVLFSIMKRWGAPIDFPYLFKKVWFVPKQDLLYYFLEFIIMRLKKVISKDQFLPSWGPRFNGIDRLRKEVSFTELCLLQWYNCCFSAEFNLLRLKEQGLRVHCLEYNQFVKDPLNTLVKIYQFLSCPCDIQLLSDSCKVIHTNSVGLGLNNLDSTTLNFIDNFLSVHPQLPLFNGEY